MGFPFSSKSTGDFKQIISLQHLFTCISSILLGTWWGTNEYLQMLGIIYKISRFCLRNFLWEGKKIKEGQ